MNSRAYWVLGTGALVLSLSLLVLGFAKRDACLQAPSPEGCVITTSHHMALSGDIAGALEYAAETVGTYKRGTMHMAMHMIGHAAYHFTGSRSRALAYIPDNSLSDEQWIVYEGYQHGVLEAYFSDRIDEEDIDSLIEESCSRYYTTEELSLDSKWRGHRQCFHAVGHGLMFAYDFNVEDAVETCRRLPRAWMTTHCAYGAYMGLSYLYSPDYMPQASRDDVSGKSMAPFCTTQRELSSICATFVGRSYFASHEKDVSGAFNECGTLQTEDARICRKDTAEYVVTLLGVDMRSFTESCNKVPGHEHTCLFSIARAIAEGYAGEDAKKEDICTYLPADMIADCRAYLNS